MFKTLHSALALLSLSLLFACKKQYSNANANDPSNYRISRVDYFEQDGSAAPFYKKVSYTNGRISRTDLIQGGWSNWNEIKYLNNNVSNYNLRLGDNVVLMWCDLKYSANNELLQIIGKPSENMPFPEQNDTTSFEWSAGKLLSVTHVTRDNRLVAEEKISYSYTGENISRCVYEGTYFYPQSGSAQWKDSIDFSFDNNPNRFKENGYSFYLDEFNLVKHGSLRNVPSIHALDPALMPFILSKNNVVEMRTNGGSNSYRFSYHNGTGVLADKLAEIKVNDKVRSRYTYERIK